MRIVEQSSFVDGILDYQSVHGAAPHIRGMLSELSKGGGGRRLLADESIDVPIEWGITLIQVWHNLGPATMYIPEQHFTITFFCTRGTEHDWYRILDSILPKMYVTAILWLRRSIFLVFERMNKVYDCNSQLWVVAIHNSVSW